MISRTRPGRGVITMMRSDEQHRLGYRMGDEQNGLRPFRPDAQQLEAHFIAGERIKRRERLVHQQNVGIEQQRPGDGDALLHAAGEFINALGGKIRKSDERKELVRTDLVLGADAAVFVAQRERDITEHIEPRQQRRPLEHDADLVARLGHLQVVDADRPACGEDQARDQPQQGRLAATGWTEHRQKFVLADIERHVFERGDRRAVIASEGLLDVGEANDVRRLAHRRAPRPARRAPRPFTWARTNGRPPSRDRSCRAACFALRRSTSRSSPAALSQKRLRRLSC